MEVYLVDGTYELFRHYFAVPKAQDEGGQEIGATRGVLNSVLSLLSQGVTHVGVASDHIVESFRNDLYPYYKTGAGLEHELFSQFQLMEECLSAMGVKVWPMVEFEADDALAAAAAKAAASDHVERVVICTPDKDLAQCVVGDHIVQMDRRKNEVRNESGVVEKFGVPPNSIPDYLALVGDTADGYPGLPGFGAKATSTLLSQFSKLEAIPKDPSKWNGVRGAAKLAATLFDNWVDVLLFRRLATLTTDVPVFDSIEELRWQGPTDSFEAVCARLRAKDMFARAMKLTSRV